MGITDGSNTYGLGCGIISFSVSGLSLRDINLAVGTRNDQIRTTEYRVYGITQNSDLAGLEADLSSIDELAATLYMKY